MSPITTHVLDTTRGKPAHGVPVTLESGFGSHWKALGSGVTDADGRLKDLLPEDHKLAKGAYRLTFDTRAYFDHMGMRAFYPTVTVTFEVSESGHYHVPLLLSPFGYSTYRGS